MYILNTRLSFRLSVFISAYFSVGPSVFLPSVFLFFCLSASLPVWLSVYLFICLLVWLSVFLSVCLSVWMFVFLSVYFFVNKQQTTKICLCDEQTVNGLRKIKRASVFRLKRQNICIYKDIEYKYRSRYIYISMYTYIDFYISIYLYIHCRFNIYIYGKRKFVFIDRQTINGNRRLLLSKRAHLCMSVSRSFTPLLFVCLSVCLVLSDSHCLVGPDEQESSVIV
jgi:hypothetical protein